MHHKFQGSASQTCGAQTILGPVWEPRILPLILLSGSFPTLSGFLTGMCSIWLNWRLKEICKSLKLFLCAPLLLLSFPLVRFSDFSGTIWNTVAYNLWQSLGETEIEFLATNTTRTQGTNHQKKKDSESKPQILAQFPVEYLLTPKLCRWEVSTTNWYLPWALAMYLYKD